jgi:hypothetical protein
MPLHCWLPSHGRAANARPGSLDYFFAWAWPVGVHARAVELADRLLGADTLRARSAR